MASPFAIVLGALAIFGIAGGLALWLVPTDTLILFLATYGAYLMMAVQIVGMFYAGMCGNVRLGLILGVTLLSTAIWAQVAA